HDEAGWLSPTAFDPRPIAADVASFRTAVRQLLGDGQPRPLTLLLITDLDRPNGAFVASRADESVLVHVGPTEPWSAALRISVAAEVIHGYIGQRLWIGPSDPEHEMEAAWFTEGLVRHVARDLNFRFGLISSADMADEVHGLIGLATTSALKKTPNAAL